MIFKELRISTGKKWSRLKHRRGHGIHSPMVYGIVNEVFKVSKNRRLYINSLKTIVETGYLSEKSCIEIQELHAFCKSSTLEIVCDDNKVFPESEFYVLAGNISENTVIKYIREAHRVKGIVCVALALMEEGKNSFDCMLNETRPLSIERSEYLFYCFWDGLSPQHFVL